MCPSGCSSNHSSSQGAFLNKMENTDMFLYAFLIIVLVLMFKFNYRVLDLPQSDQLKTAACKCNASIQRLIFTQAKPLKAFELEGYIIWTVKELYYVDWKCIIQKPLSVNLHA